MTVEFEPLKITAHTPLGVAHAAPWGVALDGLLAAQVWADIKDDYLARGTDPPAVRSAEIPPDLDLPLARCTLPASADDWHWAATCAFAPDRHPDPAVHYWTGRADHRHLEQIADAVPATISDRQGRYRARRMPLLVTACTHLTWHALGDMDRITALLEPITSIGKKRAQGEGTVTSWNIEPVSLDAHTVSHLHSDGTLGRPCPAECLNGHASLQVGGAGTAGLRPPYMHPSRRRELCLPSLWE